jgi:hypothetical protein
MKKLAYCAKFMHMLHGFNLAVLTELELALKEDIKADQTHISEPRFLKLAEPIIKIPNLREHKLFELIKEACVDPTLKTMSSFLLLQNFWLLAELYKQAPERDLAMHRFKRRGTETTMTNDKKKSLDLFEPKTSTRGSARVMSPVVVSHVNSQLQGQIQTLASNIK